VVPVLGSPPVMAALVELFFWHLFGAGGLGGRGLPSVWGLCHAPIPHRHLPRHPVSP
jgi:hypothetical protein